MMETKEKLLFAIVFGIVISLPLFGHAATLILTDPNVYGGSNFHAGSCCQNFQIASTTEQAPGAFYISAIGMNNQDFSANNHDGSGNIRAWIYDAQDNLIASSTNTCWVEGLCGSLNFNQELIPATFILRLIGDDGLQGGANFNISNVTFFGNPAPSLPAREPVIIVPGIMGTRLNRVSDGTEVWPKTGGINGMALSPSDNYLDELQLSTTSQEIQGDEMATGEIIDKELGVDVYKNLVDTFVQNGYASGTTLFTVPYDWRFDLQHELQKLDAKISEALSNSKTGKINIVAHSMGGLLVKAYLAQAISTNFLNKLVQVGVPQLGTPMAFKALNYGDNLGFDVGPFNILNPDRVKIIAQNMPGVYELLPSRRYLQANGSYVRDIRNGAAALDYDETNAFMKGNASDTRNSSLLNLADMFHQGLDNQPVNANASSVYNIVGCQNPATIGEFVIKDNNKFDINAANGDGRVPIASAMNLSNNFSNYFVRSDVTGIDHFSLTSDSRTVNLIKDIIEGNATNSLPTGISTSTSYCFTELSDFTNETTIAVSTHSPVALHAYDSQNRHTGPLANGDIELGIPGSTYEQIGENSFAFVPAGDNYRFVADGTNAGSFDMKVKKYKGSNLDNITTYLNVPLASDNTNAELNIAQNAAPADLKLDNDGDNVFETSIPPTAILSASSSADVTPPKITINSPASTDYLRSQILPITITATDTESGVTFTEIAVDGIITTSTAIDPFFYNLGNHAIFVHAVDNVGNPANTSTTFRIITTPESTAADIDRAYGLGWINEKSTRNNLITRVRGLVKTEKKIEIIKITLPNGETAERKVETITKRIDKALAQLLLKDLLRWHERDIIADQAYNIVKEDIEWLTQN